MEIKDLYMAKTMADLNKLTDKNLASNPSTVKQVINLMQVLEKKAREKELDGDQEQAYIYYMRYFDIYKMAPKCKDYKDKAYIESMIGKQTFKEILDRVTRLNDTLRERYDYLQAKRVSETLEPVDKKIETKSQKPEPVKSASIDIPETWLSSSDLTKLLKNSPNDFLILDVRPKEEYNSVTIKDSLTINIPEERIEPGYTVADINKLLTIESKKLFSERDKKKFVCLVDWDSIPDRETHLPKCIDKPNHPICIIKDAIFKWDAEYKIKNEPLILYGGMKDFLLRYPTYTTNPHFKKEKKRDDSSSSSVQSQIVYPDLEKQEAERKRLAEERKRQIIKEQEEAEKKRKELKRQEELQRVNKNMKDVTINEKEQDGLEKRFASIKSTRPSKPDLAIPSVNRSDKPPLSPNKRRSPVPSLHTKKIERSPSPTISRSSHPTNQNDPASRQSSNVVASTNKAPPQPDRRDKPPLDNVPKSKSTSPTSVPTVKKSVDSIDQKRPDSILANKQDLKTTVESSNAQSVTERPPKPECPPLYHRPSNEAPARLSVSQNSVTNDRLSFAAKGGAKPSPVNSDTQASDIPDNPNKTAGELTSTGSHPSYIEKVHDPKTNRYYYINHKTKTTSWDPPDLSEVASVKTPSAVDHGRNVTTQKLNDSAWSGKTSGSGGGQLKRCGSQPNLAKLTDGDSRSSVERERSNVSMPQVDRAAKPAVRKPIQQLDANRLRRLEPSYGSVPHGLTGLRNLGNTCYMNSVIQSLSNTPFLLHYFREGDYRRFINRSNPLGHKGEVADEFAILLSVLWAGSYKDVSPRDFRNMVARNAHMFADSHQQDSQEFLLFLLDGLHEDLNQVTQRPRTAFKDDETLCDEKRADLSWSWHLQLNESIIVSLFQGQFKSTVRCLSCDTQSKTFDAFMYLSLPIASPTRCNLKECLDLFLSEERMTGNSQWNCPNCKANRDAVKSIVIWKLPPYLLIHLKRFSCDGAYRQKLDTYVDFPINKLDLKHYVNSRQETQPYNLYAVSNHYGNMEGGHYTCYAKNMHTHSWHKFDDEIVATLRSDDVKTYAAYILFYESVSMKTKSYID